MEIELFIYSFVWDMRSVLEVSLKFSPNEEI